MSRIFRGKKLTLKVTNPSGKSKGIKNLKINGKTTEGNLVPIASLSDGAVIEATITGE